MSQAGQAHALEDVREDAGEPRLRHGWRLAQTPRFDLGTCGCLLSPWPRGTRR